jgi:hypothetical protein
LRGFYGRGSPEVREWAEKGKRVEEFRSMEGSMANDAI